MWSGLSVTILKAESDRREHTLIVAYGEVSAARQADFFVSPSDPAARCTRSTSDHRTAIGHDLVSRSLFTVNTTYLVTIVNVLSCCYRNKLCSCAFVRLRVRTSHCNKAPVFSLRPWLPVWVVAPLVSCTPPEQIISTYNSGRNRGKGLVKSQPSFHDDRCDKIFCR